MDCRSKIIFVLGTRPEVIKLAPLIKLMREKGVFQIFVCSTGQHREMLTQTLKAFNLKTDINLDLMTCNQTLCGFTSLALNAIDDVFEKIKPDFVVVQGDTTTTLVASLVAFYRRVPVGHVEAGLRTHSKFSPFPEEVNRKITGVLADLHFAPTETAQQALLNEGVKKESIWITGNTVVDAIEFMKKISLDLRKEDFSDFPQPVVNTLSTDNKSKLILITCHRRENFGSGLSEISEAIRILAIEFPDRSFVFPVHFNPNVRKQVYGMLSGLKNVFLIEPVDYKRFVRLMAASELILTDSGGIQEEIFSLAVPAFVLREFTDRGEGLNEDNNGLLRMVGNRRDDIVKSVREFLGSDTKLSYHSQFNPYGDGLASQRINDIIEAKMLRNND